jgi:hypothetical protein
VEREQGVSGDQLEATMGPANECFDRDVSGKKETSGTQSLFGSCVGVLRPAERVSGWWAEFGVFDGERENLSCCVLDADVVSTPEPPNQPRSGVQRAFISVAAAMGIKAADRRWVQVLPNLNGTFERSGFELGFYIAVVVFNAGLFLGIAGFAFIQYRRYGWTTATNIILCYEVFAAILSYYLVSQAGARYVFGGGTVSSYNTWGRLSWSEDLTGLKDVVLFSGRGTTSMRLIWENRKRSLMVFDSLRDTVDASFESANKLAEEKKAPETIDNAGPSWICPHCHEENPGNFEECWKCLRSRLADEQK